MAVDQPPIRDLPISFLDRWIQKKYRNSTKAYCTEHKGRKRMHLPSVFRHVSVRKSIEVKRINGDGLRCKISARSS